MPYKNCKIYSDGGHYIAIPSENFSHGKKPSKSPRKEQPHKAEFETAYQASQALPKKERKDFMKEQLKDCFKNEKETNEFIDKQTERKKTNTIKRRVRLFRKVHLQAWNYFVTFTYDNAKHTEETFEKSLRNTLKHLVSRKHWKYIGVFERSPTKGRLHFHGIFYIPEMIGELIQTTDYDTTAHRKQTTYQNTHFLKRFGRNDFKALMPYDIDRSVRYILKYIEKSGERLCYGGKLPTYIKGHILDDDVLCPYGVADRKLLLFDNFTCIDNDGVVMGKASPEVIKNMPKCN